MGRKWYYRPGHPKASELGFVAEEDMGPIREEPKAKDAAIMTGRFYENTAATDGTDIGSRRKHREYMKRHNVTTADDFSSGWAKADKERELIRSGEYDKKERKEAIDRAIYERYKP